MQEGQKKATKQILEELELKSHVRENVINLIWQWYARQHQIKTKQNFGRENDSESSDEFKDQHSSTPALAVIIIENLETYILSHKMVLVV